MAQLSVKVNGYVYNVGCEDGQEEHLQAMAGEVDSRIENIKALGGNSGESRLLLLAALLLADELHDLRLERETLGAAGGPPCSADNGELGKRLGRMVGKAEQIAATLEHP